MSISVNNVLNHNFHVSVPHPVACAIEVTINTVYATYFIYYPLLEDVLFMATCLGSIERSSGNIHMISRKLLYLQQIRCFLGLINYLYYTLFCRILFFVIIVFTQ
jgi:hypothetical protein